MKLISKLALVGAALASAGAYADVELPSTGNGGLVLLVRNTTTNQVYARDLGILIDSVLPAATAGGAYTGPINSMGYALPGFAADANLGTFLAASGSKVWTIMGGDSTGSVGNSSVATDARRFLITTNSSISGVVSNTELNSSYGNLNAMLGLVNDSLPDSAGSSTLTGGQWGDPGATPGSSAPNGFGAGPLNETVLGTAAHLYVVSTQNGTNTTQARVWSGLDVRLNLDGSLETLGGAPPAVPVPAAVWLLGSGLAGLVGIGRRRNNKAQKA
jgi:hypothetical protein